MKYILAIAVAMTILPAASYACDPVDNIPVISERTGEVLYYLNSACTVKDGGSVSPKLADLFSDLTDK